MTEVYRPDHAGLGRLGEEAARDRDPEYLGPSREPFLQFSEWLLDTAIAPERALACAGRIEDFYGSHVVPTLGKVTLGLTGTDWGGGYPGAWLCVEWPEHLGLTQTGNAYAFNALRVAFRRLVEKPFDPLPIMQLGVYAPNRHKGSLEDMLRAWADANRPDFLRIIIPESGPEEPVVTENYLSTSQVARELDLTPQRIRQLVAERILVPVVEQEYGPHTKVRLFSSRDVDRLRLLRKSNSPSE